MRHETIFIVLSCLVLFFLFFHIIKNRPDYLVLLGIRGLLSYIMIQFVNFACQTASLPIFISTNLLCLSAGSVLGFPGIRLLYAVRFYFYSF